MRQWGRSRKRPLYRRVADDIRTAIADGTLRPGQLLPPERALSERYDVSLVAVRAGLAVLRGEGLIVTERGKGSRVRETAELVALKIPPGATITTRMPTEPERQRLGIAEGTPILVVEHEGRTELLPGDRFAIETVRDVDGIPDSKVQTDVGD
jgi:DNA-binding GntR family transcriptional regulator